MRKQNDQIDDMPKMRSKKTDIANAGMKVQIAGQKEPGRDDGRDHAGAVRGDFSAHNQAAAHQQKHGAGCVQTRNQSREVRVLFWDQAAGLVLRRLTIKKASPNMTSENSTNVAIEEESGKFVSIPGYKSSRRADKPYVSGFKRITT